MIHAFLEAGRIQKHRTTHRKLQELRRRGLTSLEPQNVTCTEEGPIFQEFHGFKDYFKKFIKAHATELEVELDVKEEIDIRFQFEIAGSMDVNFWFDLDFLNQDVVVCDRKLLGLPLCWKPRSPVAPSDSWFLSIDGRSPTGSQPLSDLPVGKVDESLDSKMTPLMARSESYADAGNSAVKIDPIESIMGGLPVPRLDLVPVGLSTSLSLEGTVNL